MLKFDGQEAQKEICKLLGVETIEEVTAEKSGS